MFTAISTWCVPKGDWQCENCSKKCTPLAIGFILDIIASAAIITLAHKLTLSHTVKVSVITTGSLYLFPGAAIGMLLGFKCNKNHEH